VSRALRLVGSCGLTSAYSEINISGRHRPISSEICNRLLELGSRAPVPLVRASVGITDEAGSGSISGAQPRRNPTYRPSS